MTVPINNLTDTWNASGTTFNGIKMNVTDTGHAAASRLIDLQIGGSTKFSVDATGNLVGQNFTSTTQGLVPSSGGGTTNFLRADGSWAAAGGGTPGGSNLQMQYNNSTVFGGMAGTSWDDTNRSLALTGATVTTNHPVLDLSQTWNAGGVTFTALKLNITRTASASGSNVIDLQEGGTSIFNVGTQTGGSVIRFRNPSSSAYTSFDFFDSSNVQQGGFGYANSGTGSQLTGTVYMAALNGKVQIQAQPGSNPYLWSFDTDGAFGFNAGIGSSTLDTKLYRDAANTLAMRNGTTAQTFRLYNTYTDASNYERGVFDWSTASNTLTIGTQAAGTGSGRNIILISAGGNFKLASVSTSWVASIGVDTVNAGLAIATTSPDVTAAYDYWFLPATGAGPRLQIRSDAAFGWASTTNVKGQAMDTAIWRAAAKVVEFSDGAVNANGWMQWAGLARVSSDFSVTSQTAPQTVTGLQVALQSGRTYSFMIYLSCTCAAAGGVKVQLGSGAGLTATNIIYDGWVNDSNTVKAQTNATSLLVVFGTTTTATTGIVIEIQGTISVNVAGNLLVQFCQQASNGTASIVKRGSYLLVFDMP
jgi:hypothetical protein